MPRLRLSPVARCTEALIALLAPVLPLAIMLLGATPVLPAAADWLLVLPALLTALLLTGRPRRRQRSGRRRQSINAGINTTVNTTINTGINTRTAHGLLD